MNIFKNTLLKQNLRNELRIFKNKPSLVNFNNIVIKQFTSNFVNSVNFTQNEMKNVQNNKSFYYTKKNSFADLPKNIKVLMPCLAPDMEMGDFINWKKKEGDFVKENDVIAEIENGKATVDFTSTVEGFLAKILVSAGTKSVKVGTPVCLLVEDKKDLDAFKNVSAAPETEHVTVAETAGHKETPKEDENTQTVQVQVGKSDRIIASPLAKKTARENGVQLEGIRGTGPNGRIIQEDVLKAKSVEKPKAEVKKTVEKSITEVKKTVEAPISYTPTTNVSGPDFEDLDISAVRKVTAERLTYSKSSIPHFYIQIECNVDKMIELRAELNKFSPVKLSFNDIVIKAASLACMKVPEANSSWQGTFIRKYKNVDMSVAVQTDYGLITPIVTNANLKGLAQISKEVKELADKAKHRKLQPSEFIGGTFTISNMGMLGVSNFTAVINPPQSCILAVGKSEKKIVYDEQAVDKNHPYKVANIMNCTLSCDHRVVDGAFGAKWTQEFKNLFENPQLMLL